MLILRGSAAIYTPWKEKKKNLSKRNLSDHKLLWALSRLYTLEHSQIYEEKNDGADEKV